jgi:UDP-N-acetylglucosamine 4,6-dehydratase/5-epimerase
VGIRPGEKLHEDLISEHDSLHTVDAGDFFVITPEADWWPGSAWSDAPLVPADFSYRSDLNDRWLSVEEIGALIASV